MGTWKVVANTDGPFGGLGSPRGVLPGHRRAGKPILRRQIERIGFKNPLKLHRGRRQFPHLEQHLGPLQDQRRPEACLNTLGPLKGGECLGEPPFGSQKLPLKEGKRIWVASTPRFEPLDENMVGYGNGLRINALIELALTGRRQPLGGPQFGELLGKFFGRPGHRRRLPLVEQQKRAPSFEDLPEFELILEKRHPKPHFVGPPLPQLRHQPCRLFELARVDQRPGEIPPLLAGSLLQRIMLIGRQFVDVAQIGQLADHGRGRGSSPGNRGGIHPRRIPWHTIPGIDPPHRRGIFIDRDQRPAVHVAAHRQIEEGQHRGGNVEQAAAKG